MSRLIAAVVIIVAVLVGVLFLLAGHVHQRPTTHVEKAVDLANLS